MRNILKIKLNILNMSTRAICDVTKDATMNLEQRSVRFFVGNVRKQLIVNEGPRLFTVKRTKNLSNAKGPMKELEMAPRKISQKRTIHSAVICRPIGNVCSIVRNSIYAFDAAKLS